jgi:glycosyltransferase involved in cell wall biosynthesis
VVLHVLEALGGGTSKHLIDVVTHTPGFRHDVAVPRRRVGWLSDDAAVERLRDAGAGVHIVEMRREPLHPRNARALLQLRALVGSIGADIVHGHSSIGGALARVAAAGRPVRRLYTANGVAPGRVSRGIERALLHLTDHTIAVSESEGQLMIAAGVARAGALTLIPNGIDLAMPASRSLHLRETLGVPGGVPLVGGLARLVAQKGPVMFVRACGQVAARHATAHFVLIGSGVLEPEVRREVAASGMEQRFHLHPEFSSPASVLDELDVFMSTSRFEGGPYAPLEAMRAGVPVVLSDVVGNRDVVEDGVSGLIVAVDSPAGFAAAVDRLLQDGARAATMVEAARRRLEERFDVREMGRATAALYASVLATPGGSSARS